MHARTRKSVSGRNRRVQRLASNERTEEPTRKGIARAVGVHDLSGSEGVDGEDPGLVGLLRGDDDRVLRAVRDDDRARARGVDLGEERDGARDAREVLGVREPVRARPRLGLGLVADDDVGVREDAVKLLAEELGDERGGDVQDEGLVIGSKIASEYSAMAFFMGEEMGTFPAADALLLSSTVDSTPWVRK